MLFNPGDFIRNKFSDKIAIVTMSSDTRPSISMLFEGKAKKNNKVRKITWWKFLLRMWNELNPKFKPFDPNEITIPDYDYKTIKVWKERNK